MSVYTNDEVADTEPFYQEVQNPAGTSLTQRDALAFSSDFTVTDNSGSGRTEVALASSGGGGAGVGLTLNGGNLDVNLSTGKAGSQSVTGGTAASETLTLRSTAHATKGKLLFGTSGYDEANNRLGVKTASPTEAVEIASGCLAFSGSNTGPSVASGISGASTILQFWVGGTSRLAVDANGIAGSVSAAGNLQIQSTTHGTKGLILLGTGVTSAAGSAYNEALDRWSFGAGYAPGGPLAELIQLADAGNIKLGTATGTKIGTATTQLLGFWNAAPVAQHSSTGETAGFTAGGGTAVTDSSTFTGNTGSKAYRLSDVVKALKLAGIMASS